MAEYFEKNRNDDDGEFITIRFKNILPKNHPANLIKMFLETVDISNFESKYKVGKGQKGRAPKDIRMILGIILYAIYSRIYSAHKIDYATENYSDFWIFSYKKRISHDKISEFIIKHKDEIFNLFLATISLANKNNLLSFDGLFQDGFFIKANASKSKNRNLKRLMKKESNIAKALGEILLKLQQDEDETTLNEKKKEQENLEKIFDLRKKLQKRIQERGSKECPSEIKEREEKQTINLVDPDSELNRMKDDSFANSYTKICGVDSKADIIVSSDIDGHNDEAHKLVKLTTEANQNCSSMGRYDKVLSDSNFNTMENCELLEKENIELIGPTRQYENKERNPEKYKNKITFEYDEEKHVVICSEGNVLEEIKKYYDKKENTTIFRFANKAACMNCIKIKTCTESKKGYKTVKIDARCPFHKKMLERYLSEEGKALYKKRSHCGEIVQGDLKKNGKYYQLLRRGIDKVRIDSILQDIVWNLRRIFNTIEGDLIFNE